jgi:nucleoid-associated protein YgaU
VQKGDTFYKIAARVYGDRRYGRLLALRNKQQVPDARKLRTGQRILLLDGVETESAGTLVAMQ